MIADDTSLARLMALAQQGDRAAYATVLTQCERWLKRYFARRIAPCQLDDLVQDTLISLHRKLASFDPSRPFFPWLAAIARYRWVDHLRKIYRADETMLDDDVSIPSGETAIHARLSIDRLLKQLPEAQARAIALVKIDGLSIVEAATVTGQSESLVKVNIHRGLKKLTSLIESE
jgi:RNA polymerase sigma factor (sigma-70 family)